MTDKQKHILDYLYDHKGQDYYINIRDFVAVNFDNENDFETTLHQLKKLNLVIENERADTFYKLIFPNFKVKHTIPHVTLFYTEIGIPILRIEDSELFDIFDDMLTEQFGIEDYSHTQEQMKNLEVYTFYFSDTIDKEKLNKAVQSIDQTKVEKIFRLNNPA